MPRRAAPTLASRHRLHALQPVLPVADVEGAARWFCEVLGFEVDFLHGTPPVHGRLRVGRRAYGPLGWVHLALSRAPVQPCGELRLHVGAQLDALFSHAQHRGATVLQPPADQPWGTREFLLATPDGHRLRLCAAADADDPGPPPGGTRAGRRRLLRLGQN